MNSPDSSIDIKGKLLSYLRKETKDPRISFAIPPTPITGGFDTSIYKFQLKGASTNLSGPMVLRIFTRDPFLDRAPFETIVQNSLASHGYPVPKVYLKSTEGDIFGGSFLIMEFMRGQPLVNESEAKISNVLARAHLRLHSIDTNVIENKLRDAGMSKEDVSFNLRFKRIKERIESDGHDWLQPGLDWIIEHRPMDPKRLAVLHGDFHPLNILVCNGMVSGVLDWSGFMIGDPALDIAITRFLGLMAFPYYLVHIDWHRIIRLYLEHYLDKHIIDSERIFFYEVARNLMSLLEGIEGHRGWGNPATMIRLSKNFKERTGIKIVLPD